ncbi:MAG: endonuclease I [Verrucomicrobiales bacterium]|jgi:endonuclease I
MKAFRTAVILPLFLFLSGGLLADSIHPTLTGDELIDQLRQEYQRTKQLSYKGARTEMFVRIDNRDGKVALAYTGKVFETVEIPDHTKVNTEHTWPQAKFTDARGEAQMKTDLHHLFPTISQVNSVRGSNPFGEIPDADTKEWWIAAIPQTAVPTDEIDGYSESTDLVFEPREAFKGNVARAMFYFYSIYGDRRIDKAWFEPQIETLVRWHQLDSVDDSERARSLSIAEVQGNENPFVVDPTLVERAFSSVIPATVITASTPAAAGGFEEEVRPFLEQNCFKCHGPEKQKGKVALHTISGDFESEGSDIWLKILDQLTSGDMPPDDEEQPDPIARAKIVQWINLRLQDSAHAEAYREKLLKPEYGNYVSHEMLFSGEIDELPFSPARIWRFSPEIFKGKGIRGGQSPFSYITSSAGVRDYSAISGVDQSTVEMILINTDQYFHLRADEERFEIFAEDAPMPSEDQMVDAVRLEFRMAVGRLPNDEELARYMAFLKKNIADGGIAEGLKTTIKAMFLSGEAIYRMELGLGLLDEHGRRHLSPDELAYAVSYALTDRGPEQNEFIRKAVGEKRLANKTDVAAVVMQILDKGMHPKQTPRIIRFFEEFFGYNRAGGVFKDMDRVRNEGIQQWNTGRLEYEAQQLVEYFINRDENVIEEILTSNRFFIAHPGDNDLARQFYEEAIRPDYVDLKVKQRIEQFERQKRDTEAEKEKEEIARIRKQAEERAKIVREAIEDGLTPFPGWPYDREIRGQSDLVFIGVYNLPATNRVQRQQWNWEIEQPLEMPIEQRAGILTHPAWLAAHSLNDGNDPVRRGKWIQEKLLAGIIQNVPPDVDASVPNDPHLTLRERMEPLRAERCWNCHRKMNPLGEPFEIFDDWGRYRTEIYFDEKDEIVVKRGKDFQKWITEGKLTTRPVNATGAIRGTGDPEVDGEVEDAVEMMQRIGRSDRARQSIIRHLFRYFMGRNEMLSDSKTLIDAETAYLDAGGSFKALVVSLLTSDSFLYRR